MPSSSGGCVAGLRQLTSEWHGIFPPQVEKIREFSVGFPELFNLAVTHPDFMEFIGSHSRSPRLRKTCQTILKHDQNICVEELLGDQE